MKPATTSRRHFETTKLLVVTANEIHHSHVGEIHRLFRPGDILVINRSATLPSSFYGRVEGREIEVRLASFSGRDCAELKNWKAVVFGSGDWRTPTERRGLPPVLEVGDEIIFNENLSAVILNVDQRFSRLIEIEFRSDDLVRQLYTHGRPIQYSYLNETLAVWDQQTIFSEAPISVEPPSAAFPLNWQTMFELQRQGVTIASLVHGAGLSSTGDSNFDGILPLDEYYDVPPSTIEAVESAKKRGYRIVALGTTAVRALESAWRTRKLNGRTSLKLHENEPVQVVDVLLTGMHEKGTSHVELMCAFGGSEARLEGIADATEDYRSHEYGDLTWLEAVRKDK